MDCITPISQWRLSTPPPPPRSHSAQHRKLSLQAARLVLFKHKLVLENQMASQRWLRGYAAISALACHWQATFKHNTDRMPSWRANYYILYQASQNRLRTRRVDRWMQCMGLDGIMEGIDAESQLEEEEAHAAVRS